MASLARGRSVGLVAYYFRLDKMALVRHCQHEPIAAIIDSQNDGESPLPETETAEGVTHREARRHWLGESLAGTPDELPAVDETVLGEANLQDTAERHFRTGWKLMNDPRRAKNLVWLQEQLREVSYEVSYE